MGLAGRPRPGSSASPEGEQAPVPGWPAQRCGVRLPAGPSLHPSGPSAESRSLFLFNLHLEKLNLASWKPARRVKFLATSRVFHFPAPAMLPLPPV